MTKKGWKGESARHSAAKKGVKTKTGDKIHNKQYGTSIKDIIDYKINSGRIRQVLSKHGWTDDEIDYLFYKEKEVGERIANEQYETSVQDVVDYRETSGKLRQILNYICTPDEIDYFIYERKR